MQAFQELSFLRWPLVLAVVAAFVLLRYVRARTFAWALACWLGTFAFCAAGGNSGYSQAVSRSAAIFVAVRRG